MTALATAGLDDGLAGAIRHAVAEAVLAGSAAGLGLVRALHEELRAVSCATAERNEGRPDRVLGEPRGPPRGRRQSYTGRLGGGPTSGGRTRKHAPGEPGPVEVRGRGDPPPSARGCVRSTDVVAHPPGWDARPDFICQSTVP